MAEGGLLYWRRQRPDGTKYQDFEELLRPLPPPPDGMMWVKTRIVVAEGEEEEGEEEETGDQEEGEEAAAAAWNEEKEQQENGSGGGLPIATPVERGEEVGADEAPRRTRPPRCVTRWELVERVAVGKSGDNDEGGQGGSGANGQEGGGDNDDMLEGENEGEGTGPAFLTHTVLHTDTMQGLRLRYKVTPAELRLHNDFAGEQFHMLHTLKIPLKQDVVSHVAKFRQRPTQAVLRQRFTNATKCTDEQEISYYLESAEWKLSVALTEYQEDRAWEEAHHAHVQMACLPGPPLPLSIQATAAAAAAVGGTAPAAFSSNTMLSRSSTAMSQESTPPPSYSSFFRVPRRGGGGGAGGMGQQKKKNGGSIGYLSSWSAFGGGKKKASKIVYDMNTFIAEDYVILPGAQGEGGADHGDEEGSVVAPAASLLPSSVGGGAVAMVTGEDDHPQTPLLARAAVRG